MTTPTPPIFYIDEPFVCIVHRVDLFWISSSLGMVNSVMKSANTWAFKAIQGLYSMLNWLCSIVHCTIRPTALGLFIAFLIGWSIITKMGFT